MSVQRIYDRGKNGEGGGGREGDPEIPCLESVISNVLFLLPFSQKRNKNVGGGGHEFRGGNPRQHPGENSVLRMNFYIRTRLYLSIG